MTGEEFADDEVFGGTVTTIVLSTSVRIYWRGWSAKGLIRASSTMEACGGAIVVSGNVEPT